MKIILELLGDKVAKCSSEQQASMKIEKALRCDSSKGQAFLALDYMMMGDANLAVKAASSCIQAAEREGELHQAIHGHIIKGFAQIRQSRRDHAKAGKQQAQRLAAQMGNERTNLYFLALGAEIERDSEQYAEAAGKAELSGWSRTYFLAATSAAISARY